MTTPDLDALDAPLTKARHEDPMQSVVYDDCFYSLESAGIQLAEAYDEDTAALIVAAVNALPALLARVRELERTVAAADAAYMRYGEMCADTGRDPATCIPAMAAYAAARAAVDAKPTDKGQ